MRTHLLAAALVLGLCGAAAAQDITGDLESSWKRSAVRAHEVLRSTQGADYFLTQAPLGGDVSEPTLIIDSREGHAVVLTPGQDAGLVRIQERHGARIAFGAWNALHVTVFDAADQKVFEGAIARPEGRVFLSVKPGWDDERCRRALHAHRLTVRAIGGDMHALQELHALELDKDDHVERMLLAEVRDGDRPSQTPEQPYPPSQPPVQQPYPPPQPPAPPTPPPPQPCADADFQSFLESLQRAPFDDDKLNILRSFSRNSYFLVDQVAQVSRAFAFDDGKVQAIGVMNARILDRQNFYKLYDTITFSSGKDKLRKIEDAGR